MPITLNGTTGVTYPDGVLQGSGVPTASATSGAPLVSNGTIYTQNTAVTVAFGGTGANTLTGYVKGSGTSAMTASSTVPTSDLTGTLAIANGGTNSTSTPAAGGAVYGTGSAYAITSAGTTGQALISNGSSAPSWGSSIVSGTAVSASGTSIDFTSIPSWVKRITVMFNGVSGSGTANLLLQLGTSGGIVSTGYVSSGFRINAGTTSGGNSSTAGMILGSDNASWTTSGIATFALVGSNIWIGSFSGKGTTTSGLVSGMDVSLGGTLDRVRLTTSNGTDTLDAGSINILYE